MGGVLHTLVATKRKIFLKFILLTKNIVIILTKKLVRK